MQSIHIQKLGPVGDFRADIPDFMILAGEQASGKSTIAKAVFFFKNIPELMTESIIKTRGFPSSDGANGMTGPSLEDRVARSICLRFLRTFGPARCMDPRMRAEYRYADNVSIMLSLETDDTGTRYVRVDLSDPVREALREIGPLGWDTARDRILGLFRLDGKAVFIPAGRSMPALLSDQIEYIYATMDDTQKGLLDACTQNFLERVIKLKPAFRKDLSAMAAEVRSYSAEEMDHPRLQEAERLIPRILRGRYRYVNGAEFLYLPDGQAVPIKFASAGQQESVWILNILYYFLLHGRKGCFIIEEPESHLDPETQKLITDFIALAGAGGSQVLVTTHSPYVLGELDSLLRAGNAAESAGPEDRDRAIPPLYRLESGKFAAFRTDGGQGREGTWEDILQIYGPRDPAQGETAAPAPEKPGITEWMETMEHPSFEEYKEEVRRVFSRNYWTSLSPEEVDDFLNREDDFLHEMLEDDKKAVEEGTAPKDYVLNAGASAAAYALDLMYE